MRTAGSARIAVRNGAREFPAPAPKFPGHSLLGANKFPAAARREFSLIALITLGFSAQVSAIAAGFLVFPFRQGISPLRLRAACASRRHARRALGQDPPDKDPPHEGRRSRRHRRPYPRRGLLPPAGRRLLAAVRGGGEQIFQGRQAADHRRDRRLLPRAKNRPRHVHRRQRARDRQPAHPERGGGGGGGGQFRHDDRLRFDRSAQGQDGRARGAAT